MAHELSETIYFLYRPDQLLDTSDIFYCHILNPREQSILDHFKQYGCLCHNLMGGAVSVAREVVVNHWATLFCLDLFREAAPLKINAKLVTLEAQWLVPVPVPIIFGPGSAFIFGPGSGPVASLLDYLNCDEELPSRYFKVSPKKIHHILYNDVILDTTFFCISFELCVSGFELL